jgi:hypothetical protein
MIVVSPIIGSGGTIAVAKLATGIWIGTRGITTFGELADKSGCGRRKGGGAVTAACRTGDNNVKIAAIVFVELLMRPPKPHEILRPIRYY